MMKISFLINFFNKKKKILPITIEKLKILLQDILTGLY